MWDFNAWVGIVHVAWPRVIVKYDLCKINNGQWLAGLCASSELTVTDTNFKHMYMATSQVKQMAHNRPYCG